MKPIDLKMLSNSELHSATIRAASEERIASVKVIEHLREVARRDLHLELGFKSLHDYANRALGLSHGSAQRRVAAAQVIESLPVKIQAETLVAIETARTNLTTLVAAKSFFYQEKKSKVEYNAKERAEIVKSLEEKNYYEVEKELVSKAKGDYVGIDLTAKVEMRPARGGRVKIEFLADESLKDKLDRIRNLVAHRNPNPSMEELLEIMSEIVLKKIDPTLSIPKKKELPAIAHLDIGAISKSVTNAQSISTSTRSRTYKKAHLHALWTRAQSQCEFIAFNGQRCTSKYGLEVDHITPFSFGGANDLSNLRLCCRAHNGFAWKRWKAKLPEVQASN